METKELKSLAKTRAQAAAAAEKKKKEELPEGLTKQQVAAWKETYGSEGVHMAILPTEEENVKIKIVFITPDRRTMDMWEKFSDKDPGKASDILIKNLVKHGKEKLAHDDMAYRACLNEIYKKVPIGEGETINL